VRSRLPNPRFAAGVRFSVTVSRAPGDCTTDLDASGGAPSKLRICPSNESFSRWFFAKVIREATTTFLRSLPIGLRLFNHWLLM
jgi:hypothetical protein